MSSFAQAKVNVQKYVFVGYLVHLLEKRIEAGDKKAEEFNCLLWNGDYDHVLMQGFRERDEESDDSVVGKYKIHTDDSESREIAIEQVQTLIKQVLGATGGIERDTDLGCDMQYLSDKLGYSDHDLTSIKFTLLKEYEGESTVVKATEITSEG